MTSTSEGRPLLSSTTSFAPSPMIRYQLACATILLAQFLERIAFYGLVCNLVYALNRDPYSWGSDNAMTVVFLFTGTAYCTALFGGWIADAFLGKFFVITIGYILCIAFYWVFPLLYWDVVHKEEQKDVASFCKKSSFETIPMKLILPTNASAEMMMVYSNDPAPLYRESCSDIVVLALFFIGLGDGFIRSVIAPLGADQVQASNSHDATRTFFNVYYWILNIGALLSYLVLALVQQDFNIFWGYMAPYIFLILSGAVFVVGKAWYTERSVRNSLLCDIFGVIWLALKRSVRLRLRKRRHKRDQARGLPRTNSNSSLTSIESDGAHSLPNWLDLAKVRYGGKYRETMVNDVRCFIQVTIVISSLVFYYITYFQMETTFKIQGFHMRVDMLEKTKFEIPVAWLTLCNVLTVVLVLPLFNYVLYPLADRFSFLPSPRCRMLCGMFCAVAAMLVAGLVEHYRLINYWGADNDTPWSPKGQHNQTIGDTDYFAADMPIYWQVPQYILVGLSEILTTVAGLEFAYSHAPKSMQSLVTGFFWFASGAGSLLGSALLQATRGVILFNVDHVNINCRIPCPHPHSNKVCHYCHLDYYFFALAVLQIVGMVVFFLITWVWLPRGPNSTTVTRQLTQSRLVNKTDTRTNAGSSEPPVEVDSTSSFGASASTSRFNSVRFETTA